MSRVKRHLASVIQDRIPSEIFQQFHEAKACGRPGVRFERDPDTDELRVVWRTDGRGIPPTDAEIEKSVNWLADRGHGTPVQSITLDGHLRTHSTSAADSLDLSSLTPIQLAKLRDALTIRAAVAEEGETTSATHLPELPTSDDQQDPSP